MYVDRGDPGELPSCPIQMPGIGTDSNVPPVSPPVKRWANIERLRILALLEIVGFHAATDRVFFIGGVGLAAFLILTNLFNCTASDKRGFRQFARDKINRLLWPWIFWSAVYGALRIAFAILRGNPIGSEFDALMVLYGTNVHLWFIPFAMVSGIVVGYVQSRTRALPHGPVIATSATIGAGVLLVSAYVPLNQFPTPFSQFTYAAAAPFIGFAMGRTLLIESSTARRFTRIALCVAAVAFGVVAYFLPIERMAVRYAIMVIVITIALVWPGKNDWLTRRLTPLLLGVYLVHPLLIRLSKQSDWSDQYVLPYAVAIFIASAFTVWAMRKTVLKRFV